MGRASGRHTRSAAARRVLDRDENFNLVFGSSRGSQAETQKDLESYLAALAVGDLHPALLRLHEDWVGVRELGNAGSPMSILLDAFAQASAAQAADRWRPHLPALVRALGVEADSELLRLILAATATWIVEAVTYDTGMFLDEGDLTWNAGYADAQLGEGLGAVLAPVFRHAPKRRMVAAIGDDAYFGIDRASYREHRQSASRRARIYSIASWGALFSMLGDEGCDLQPGKVDGATVKTALTATFKNLVGGRY